MPELKISEFDEKTSLGNNDLIPIVDKDVSPNVTKKITLENAKSALQGEQGIQGIPGESFNWVADGWQAETIYSVNDCINYNGNGYVCIVEHTSNSFAADLAEGKWSLFVQKGDKGDTGDTGPIGETGANINLMYGTSLTPPSSADDGTLYVTYVE